LWINTQFPIVGNLLLASSGGLVDSLAHRLCEIIAIHVNFTIDVSCSSTNGLHQRSGRAKEAFLVGVEYRNQGNLREVKTLS
jgi:hypothetical protein